MTAACVRMIRRAAGREGFWLRPSAAKSFLDGEIFIHGRLLDGAFSGVSSLIHRVVLSDLREVEAFIGGLLAETPTRSPRIATLRRRRSGPILAEGVSVSAG
ncbi:hypothetical protein [Mycobacterium colombiense]|uniref:hypothetical protein n=1 Tax=Mycobacterium colombiense TaxID=339268 RepID=UPI0015C539B4|nr:hypothetical protein [Mycobacterium colombiense]